MSTLLRALGVTAIDLPVIDAADLSFGRWVLVVSDDVIQAGVIEEIVETDDGRTFARLYRPWVRDRKTHDIVRTTFYAIEPVEVNQRFSLESLMASLRGEGVQYRLREKTPKIVDLIDTNIVTVPVTLDMTGTAVAVFENASCVRRETIHATKNVSDRWGARTEYALHEFDDFIDGSTNPVIVIPEDADA